MRTGISVLLWSLEGIQESQPNTLDRGGGAATVDKEIFGVLGA